MFKHVLLFLVFFSSCVLFSQNKSLDTNYYPLAVGNKWLYHESSAHDSWWSSQTVSTVTEKYFVIEVTDVKTVNGKEYFLINGKWQRYDKQSKRIYTLNGTNEDLYCDFTLPENSIINGYTFVVAPFSVIGISDIAKGLSRIVTGSNTGTELWYYMNNIGFAGYGYSAGGTFDFYTVSQKVIEVLFADTLQGHNSINNYQPNISFVSTSVNENATASINFVIDHPLTIRSAQNGFAYTKVGCSFISSATLEYFYTNGVDTVWKSPISLTNSQEINYVAQFQYNYDLINLGYTCYYKLTAKDLSLIPHTKTFPETGFAEFTTNSSPFADYFPLGNNDSWVYKIEEVNLTSGNTQFVKYETVKVLKDTLLLDNLNYSKVSTDNNIEYLRIEPSFGITVKHTSSGTQKLDALYSAYSTKFASYRFGQLDSFKCTNASSQKILNNIFAQTKRFVATDDYRKEYKLSKGFGITYKAYYSSTNGEQKYYKGTLVAARINNIAYGDSILLTDVNDEDITTIPTEFSLGQNYPNPFNPSTNINISIAKQGNYQLKVYNLLGQLVATPFNGELSVGSHVISFSGSDLATGIYIYQLSGNNINLSKKMMMIK